MWPSDRLVLQSSAEGEQSLQWWSITTGPSLPNSSVQACCLYQPSHPNVSVCIVQLSCDLWPPTPPLLHHLIKILFEVCDADNSLSKYLVMAGIVASKVRKARSLKDQEKDNQVFYNILSAWLKCHMNHENQYTNLLQ